LNKTAVFAVILAFLVSGSVFAEFQLEPSIGYFFNTDNYDGVERSFNGMDLNISLRYLFTKNMGLFFGADFKSWFSANNDEYIKNFQSAGMKADIDESNGYKLDLNFGIALAYPISEKFGLQTDLGLSATVLALDFTSAKLEWEDHYYYYRTNISISIDNVSSMGFYAGIFGKYLVMQNGYLTFGVRLDYKFNRKEKGEIITAGISQKYSGDADNFSGFAVCPFIGFMGSY